ncbi:imelysin family protein [Oryzibacter oryziterrae]|uniref:imelysin family protein n=1 Tax=Oryzibacter oryziterrae TaxID=2766474 RepID=UPI001F3EE74D|nr:imelysin family protein [Oryzibacter oryziterrae]
MIIRNMVALLVASVSLGALAAMPAQAATDEKAVVRNYVTIGEAVYSDALAGAVELQTAVNALIANPSDTTLAAAKAAWIKARPPYMRSEVFRFGNPIVDDWEGRVNSWPLDEGLIDYVDPSYGTSSDANAYYTLNIIANPHIKIGGKDVDATNITPDLLHGTLQNLGDVETNVATGYHAIEFLLWGQDLNGTGPGAGKRPYTDYDTKACTGGNCDRRAAYLKAATDLLVSDLKEMVGDWADSGPAAKRLLDADPKEGLAALLTGMGSLSYGELAGERTKLGLLLHDPEEEHDCFSDNTFNSHYNDVVGIHDIFYGTYTRLDGSVIKGPSVDDLLKEKDPAVEKEVAAKLEASLAAASALKKRGETVEAFDQMIAEGNTEGNAVVDNLVKTLVDQVPSIERAVTALGLGSIAFEGSDSLDNPSAVAK